MNHEQEPYKEPEGFEDIWEQVKLIAAHYIIGEVADAYEELVQEIDPTSDEHCGCITCAHKAVNKLNSLIDLQFGEEVEQAQFYKYKVVPTPGGFEIREWLDDE